MTTCVRAAILAPVLPVKKQPIRQRRALECALVNALDDVRTISPSIEEVHVEFGHELLLVPDIEERRFPATR